MSAATMLRGAAAGALLLVPGLAFAQAAPSDFTYATRYDAARRVTGTIAPDPDGAGPLHHLAVRNSYDLAGRLIKVEKGELSGWQSEAVAPVDWPTSSFSIQMWVDTSYDAMSRKTLEVTRSGTTSYTATQYSYNDQGLLECTAVRMNPAVYGSLPASACTLGTEGAQGPDRITRNAYDAAGQLLTVQKAYGTGLQQDYATYTYSANGKRLSVKDANGNLASMSYDGFDRQSRWSFPSKTSVGSVSGDDYEAYDYDPNGNRTSVRRRDGRTLTFTYDALNRMTSKIVPDGCAPIHVGGCTPASATRDVYYGYDLRGLQTYARFDSASGEGITTSYNGFSELAQTSTSIAGLNTTLTYNYDENGNRVRITYPDGQYVKYFREGLDRLYYADLNGATSLFYPPYDSAGRVSTIYRWVGGAWSAPTSYGYDGTGRATSMAHAIGGAGVTSNFSYNPASQITSRTSNNDAYAFTGYVNINRGYGVNGLNQYISAGPATFAYDANGNLVSDGATSYVYDSENRLVSASNGAALTYDPLGRLWQTAGGAAGVTRFLYDGDQLTAEYDGAGIMLRRYVHSEGQDDPLVWYEGAGTSSPRYLYADHQGSIVGVADASGTIANINAYDEYGIPKAGNTLGTSGRFQYTGQAWIPELGMYHYKARIYSPTLGRFLQTDPIGYDDQINLYAYVANDPVNGTDPTGTRDLRAEAELARRAAQASAAEGAAGRAAIAAIPRLSVLALPLALSGDTPKPESNILYRGVTPADANNMANGKGINATNPTANVSADTHIVRAPAQSPFISTSKDFATAARYATNNGKSAGNVVVIDGSKVPNKTDYSNGSFQLSIRGNALAIYDSEVLVDRHIPQGAIVGRVPLDK